MGDEFFDVLGQQVALDIDRRAGLLAPQGGHLKSVGNERARKAPCAHTKHRQADAVHRDRAFFHQVARLLRPDLESEQLGIPFRLDGNDLAHAVDVTVDQMAV